MLKIAGWSCFRGAGHLGAKKEASRYEGKQEALYFMMIDVPESKLAVFSEGLRFPLPFGSKNL
jgi:hypothetical protein